MHKSIVVNFKMPSNNRQSKRLAVECWQQLLA